MSFQADKVLPRVVNDLAQILALLPRKEQSAVRRFYCDGEPDDLICNELDLDLESFRQLRRELKLYFKRTVSQEHDLAQRIAPRGDAIWSWENIREGRSADH
jgi:hypothetical protein